VETLGAEYSQPAGVRTRSTVTFTLLHCTVLHCTQLIAAAHDTVPLTLNRMSHPLRPESALPSIPQSLSPGCVLLESNHKSTSAQPSAVCLARFTYLAVLFLG
jgi:hypothetical protein